MNLQIKKQALIEKFFIVPYLLVFLAGFFGIEIIQIGELSIRFGFLFFLFGFFFIGEMKNKKISLEDLYLILVLLFAIKSYIAGAGIASVMWPLMMISAYLFGLKASKLPDNVIKNIKNKSYIVFFYSIIIFSFFNIKDIYLILIGVAETRSLTYFFGYYDHFNIAATTLGLLAIMYVNDKERFYFFACFCLSFSVLNSSRVGFISFIIATSFFYFTNYKKSIDKYILVLIVLSVIIIVTPLFFSNLTDRLTDFRTELEYFEMGQGRLALWSAAINSLNYEIFGFGIGESKNSIINLSDSPLGYREDALHNIYLQTLVDNGIFCFLILCGIFLKYSLALKDKSNIKSLIFCFLFLSFFQNSGYEHFIWFFLGYAQKYRRG